MLSSLMAYRENSNQDDEQFKPKRKFKIEKVDKNTKEMVKTITYFIQLIMLIFGVVFFCKGDNIISGKAFLSIIIIDLFSVFWKHNYSFSKE